MKQNSVSTPESIPQEQLDKPTSSELVSISEEEKSLQQKEIDDFSPLDCGPETALFW